MIIAITGTPGTGKTEIAKYLGKILKAKVIRLNQLAEEKKLYCGYDRKRECPVVDIGKVRKEVEKIKEKNHIIIIESHYAHDMPADLIIVLRCSISELRKRLEKRGWPPAKINENVEAEIMEVCLEEARGTGRRLVVIGTAGKTPLQAAKETKIEIQKKWSG